MREHWDVIEAWLAEQAPDADPKLRSPASGDAIATAEKHLGRAFPDDFRASLAIHDGQDDEPGCPWLPAVDRLGSLESLTRCYVEDRDDAEDEWRAGVDVFDEARRVRQCYWDPRWIPIAGSTYWDYDRLLLDMHPGPEGNEGQVIVRWSGQAVYLCASFGELMERTAEGMTSGRIVMAKGRVQWLSPKTKKPIPYGKFYA